MKFVAFVSVETGVVLDIYECDDAIFGCSGS